ncbi:adaptor protein MecA [Ethanoligenens sp.]|uniref:adaptor protein MecA n=1 Tax=Ethanoligenens sp. TaxID=2099655 RepID=UPI0039E89D53
MNIEKLSPDKLRVTLESAELDRYDLDYISINNESPGTKRMLKDILFEAFSSVGFSTKGSRLLIEVLPGKNEGCVLYLTKVETTGEKRAADAPARHKVKAAPQSYLLVCRTLEDAINAVGRFSGYPDIPLRRSAMYCVDGQYNLVFSPVRFGLDGMRLNALLAELSEYGKADAATPLREAVMAEHGSTIQKEHAVEQFMRYFQ